MDFNQFINYFFFGWEFILYKFKVEERNIGSSFKCISIYIPVNLFISLIYYLITYFIFVVLNVVFFFIIRNPFFMLEEFTT